MFRAKCLRLVDPAMTYLVANAQRILTLFGHDAARTEVREDKSQDFASKFGVIAWQVPMLYKDETVMLALAKSSENLTSCVTVHGPNMPFYVIARPFSKAVAISIVTF